ncbi:hypothetical protein K440DRAFT_616197 [Wilcoxina mikolae CBS 423.85]|nr:hypothetical protein K440DRAFT_616197 [Wilcoxina mikolae CBS 423.85]
MGLNPETLMSLKVTELRTELRKRGLQATGLKQVLVDRLKEDLLKEAEAEDEESAQDESAEDVNAEEEETRPEEDAIGTEVVESAKEPSPEKRELSVVIEKSPVEKVVNYEDDAPVEEEKEEEEEEEVQEQAVAEDAPTTPEQTSTEDAPTAQEPLEEDAKPAPEEAPVVDAPATPGPEAMDEVSYDDNDAIEEKPVEKELEPIAATEETRSASPDPSPAVPEESPEVEMESLPVEPAPQEDHAKALLVEDAPTDAMNATAETADETSPTAAAVDDTTTPPPEPISDDIPPETVAVEEGEAMEIDPSESLKRKRRSASPRPPHLREGDAEQETALPSAKKQRADSPPRRGRDARFKGLFNDNLPAAEQEPEIEDEETPIGPALHPATRALYIRNLVRPLQEQALRSHVLALASRNDDDPADALIELFYVDIIKSHALIVFESPTAANRVRVGIHNKIFPAEKTRKPLWADFVPEESVPGWVSREKARGLGTRWEVVYDTVGDEVTAELVEAGMGGAGGRFAGRMGSISAGMGVVPGAGAGRSRGSIDISNAPSGPRRGSDAPPAHAKGPTERKPIVMNLDQLFQSTRTKPKLYFLPVAESLARSRLAKQGRDSRGRY